MKKNIFDKFQDKFSNMIENFSKREDKDALKKIPFWLVFFFPYALYLFFFKTKVKKFIKVLVGVILALFIVIYVDVVRYPNRVYDEVATKTYNEFIEENSDLNLIELSYLTKNTHFKIGEQMYFLYNIYDKFDMYNAVFKVNSYNKDYELVSLYDVDYIFENIYTTNEFESLVGIHPLIFSFIFANSKTGVSDIIEESEVIEGDLLENYLYQIIKIDNISYLFELNDFGVTKVIKLSDEDLDLTIPTLIENVDSVDDNTKVLYSVTTHSILLENMTQNTKNLIVENFGSNFELIGYNYVATSHYYNFKIGDKYYNAKYIPGYKSELNAINDTESFKEDIEKILQK